MVDFKITIEADDHVIIKKWPMPPEAVKHYMVLFDAVTVVAEKGALDVTQDNDDMKKLQGLASEISKILGV